MDVMGTQIDSSNGWPTNLVITEVIRQYPSPLNQGVKSLEWLPTKDVYSNTIRWDSLGVAGGMTHAHSMNSDPVLVSQKPLSSFSVDTKFWKDTGRITEDQILTARAAGQLTQLAAWTLVAEEMMRQNQRVDTRMEWLGWNCLMGAIDVNDTATGIVFNQSYGIPGGNQMTPSTPWSTIGSATPLLDLQAADLKYRGTGASAPKVFMNRVTLQWLAQNTAIQNLVKNSILVPGISLDKIASLVVSLIGSIDSIELYDEGFLDDTNSLAFTTYIPDGVVIMAPTKRYLNQAIGRFALTPSTHVGGFVNPTPGKFAFLSPYDGPQHANPRVDITTGFYGLPYLLFPQWIMILTVGT